MYYARSPYLYQMRTSFCWFIFLLVSNLSWGQKEDQIWLLGNAIYDQTDPPVAADTTWGATNIDFGFDPPKVYYDPDRLWDFLATNTSICDSSGAMLLYTNRQAVYNGNHDRIVDTVNYNSQWDAWTTEYLGLVLNYGLPAIQGALILPYPNKKNEFLIFYDQFDRDKVYTHLHQYAHISVNHTGDPGVLMTKDQILVQDSLSSGGVTAVRHGNGRDWWLVFPGRNSSKLYRFLIDPSGIKDYGFQIVGQEAIFALGQAYFTPAGNKIALHGGMALGPNGTQITFMDFDRCTGEFSNAVYDRLESYGGIHGTSFSPNGRFAYASNEITLHQFDMWASDIIGSKILIAEYDGFNYYYPFDPTFAFPTTIGWMGLAPDGRIYISAGSGSNRKMHVMHYPNREGEDCDLRQHSLHIPTSYGRTIPNFPNYRLGPLDGSPCDTLGLDNIPVAKFRCDQDTLDELSFQFIDLSYFEPTEWTWIINGEQITLQHPIYDFDENGVYSVCLEVRNNNGFDTTCKTISLGVSSTEDEKKEIPLTLFPNPVEDVLTVSLHDYYPVNAQFILYDIDGRALFSKALHGTWNSYDLSSLNSAIYFYKIVEGKDILKSGKLSKI